MSETFDIKHSGPPATRETPDELCSNSSEPGDGEGRRLGMLRGMPLRCRSSEPLARCEGQLVGRAKAAGARIVLGTTGACSRRWSRHGSGTTMLRPRTPRKATLGTTAPVRTAARGAAIIRAWRATGTSAAGTSAVGTSAVGTTVAKFGAAWRPCGLGRFTGVRRKMLSPHHADCFTLVTFAFECVEQR